MSNHLRDVPGFLSYVLRRWRDDRCPQIAGSLTYTTLLALAPTFAIAVAVLSSAPFFEDLMAPIKVWLLLNMAPEIAGRIITVYMEEFAANAARLTWTGIALVAGLAIWLMLIMDRSFNAIWRVRPSRPYWVSVLGYMALLVSGPILLGVSITITTYIMSLPISGIGGTVHAFFLRAVPVAMSALAFFLIYRIVPHRRTPWRHALLGGVVASVMFEAAKELFSFYARTTPAYGIIYGAFAAVPLFLIWVYLSWLVVLFGAELTASAAFWRGGLWKHKPSAGVRFREGVAVTQALLEVTPAAVSFKRLQERTRLPPGELSETLEQMVDAGVVRLAARDGYALTEGTREVLAMAPLAQGEAVKPPRRGTARSD